MRSVSRLLVLATTLGLSCASAQADFGDLVSDITESAGDVLGGAKRMVGLGDRTEDLEGRLIDQLADDGYLGPEGPTEEERAAGHRADRIQIRMGGVSPVEISRLEGYAGEVLDKVLTGWHGNRYPARIVITSSPDFSAFTYPHGVITLSLGTLSQLQSEDELAALLAHEVSHLLLEHRAKDSLSQVSGQALKYGMLYVRARSGSTSDVLSNYAKLKVAGWVVNGAFFPKWSRGQENEADILGTDLLVRAGYNRDAMLEVLKKVGGAVQQRQEIARDNPLQVADSAEGGTAFRFDLGVLLGNIEASLTEEFGKEYEAIDERVARVRQYGRKQYRASPRPALRKQAYQSVLRHQRHRHVLAAYEAIYQADEMLLKDQHSAGKAKTKVMSAMKTVGQYDPVARNLLSYLREVQGRSDLARKNRELALKSGQAPYGIYATLLQDSMARDDLEGAARRLAEIEQTFGSQDSLLPTRIELRKRRGERTGELEAACLLTGDANLIEACNKATRS